MCEVVHILKTCFWEPIAQSDPRTIRLKQYLTFSKVNENFQTFVLRKENLVIFLVFFFC